MVHFMKWCSGHETVHHFTPNNMPRRVYRRTRVRRTTYVKRRIGPLSRARSASAIAKSRLGMRGRNPNVTYN